MPGKNHYTSRPSWWLWGTLLIGALCALPIVTVLAAFVLPSGDNWQHMASTVVPVYLLNTVLLMGGVAAISLLVGVSTAWLTAAREFPLRRLLSWLLVLPLAAPGYVVAYVYTDLLEFSGPVQTGLRGLTGWQGGEYVFPAIRSLPGAAVILSLVLYPYVFLLCRAVFVNQSSALFDSARVLGASRRRAFFAIALPSARPAVAGGLALVLMETVADYGVVEFFGVPTFTTGIFRTWFGLGDRAAALQLAAGLFVVVAFLVLLERLGRRGRVSNPVANRFSSRRSPIEWWDGWLATAWCALPVLLGFVVPMWVLAGHALNVGDPMFGRSFSDFVLNTFGVAAVAAVIACGCALWLVYTERQHRSAAVRIGTRVATLGYALPGAVVALGVLIPLTFVDRWLAEAVEQHLGVRGQLWLTGSVAVLIFAYVVRFLTVAYNACQGGIEKIHIRFDDVGRTLGATPARLLREVHLPLMAPAVMSAGLLVFVDVAKELPATLILRPFNFETLATRVYRLASDERLPEASLAALCIVCVSLLPSLLLAWQSRPVSDTAP